MLSESSENSLKVLKRGGSLQQYIPAKLRQAIKASFDHVRSLSDQDESLIAELERKITAKVKDLDLILVEEIQDSVEEELMEAGLYQEAKAYILRREKRREFRAKRLKMPVSAISEYVFVTKYAKYLRDKQRRESYSEAVNRSREMHLEKYPQIAEDINWAFDQVLEKKALPSMRSLQFAGVAIKKQNNRIYNCSFSLCDRMAFFSEALYLLLCGTGVGFSVQKQHVAKLPPLARIDQDKVVHHLIEDSIEGWADALSELLFSYVEGTYIEFAYHKIRRRGTPLITSGGRAPGHYFLKLALERIRVILEGAQGRHLKPLECHDIICVASDAVLSGGVRRSACISLFSLDDGEMMTAKTGQWFNTHPWRSNANNSAVLIEGQFSQQEFEKIFVATKEFGEPGFYFTHNPDVGINPCGEARLNPLLEVTEENLAAVRGSYGARFRAEGFPEAQVGSVVTGWQQCNLTETNASLFETEEDMLSAMKAAAIIGTCQAGYTNFPYLGAVSELITSREALIGVSMTGMVDRPDIAFNPEFQRNAAEMVKKTNQEIAKKIGINNAARTVNIKPSGSTSLLLGCVGSGIGTHHSRRYFRRIQANPVDPVYKHFKAANPHMCSPMKADRDVVTFCVEAPEKSWIKDDLGAVDALKTVVKTQENFVESGTAYDTYSPGCHHGVSNTIMVREDEWEEIKAFIWENRTKLQGLTLLGEFSDKIYANAPREAVITEEDEIKWNYLIENYQPVDFTLLLEEEDNTHRQAEVSCAGGACEVSF